MEMNKSGRFKKTSRTTTHKTFNTVRVIDPATNREQEVSEMSSSSVENLGPAISRLLQNTSRLDKETLGKFKRYMEDQWRVSGRDSIMRVFRDPEFQDRVRKFNPLTNISERKSWSGSKRQEALMNLLTGVRDGIDNSKVGASCFIKSGEQSKLESPYPDLDADNRTADPRARPRLV